MENFLCGAGTLLLTLRHSGVKGSLLTVNEWDFLTQDPGEEGVFSTLIDKSPLQRGTSAILCMADQLGAFDKENLIVPISLI